MPVDFLDAGVCALSWGATYLVHSTILLCGTWLFLQWKRSLGYVLRETLWKTALIGGIVTASAQMLLPPAASIGKLTLAVDDFRLSGAADGIANREQADVLPSSAISKWTAAEEWSTVELTEGDRPVPDGEIGVVLRDAHAEAARGNAGTATAAASPLMATEQRALGREGEVPAALIFGGILCAGLVAVGWGISRCLWQSLTLRRKLRHCSPISAGPVRRLLDELLVHIPRPAEVLLFADPSGPEPAAFGIRCWTILLPERAMEELSDDELRALLAHELAHLVRGDAHWLCISRLICSCLAFQPLNHLARREWQRAAEFLCDEWAVSRTGARLALARCLAEVAGWRLSGRPSAALLAATGRKSSLADRIERLVSSADVQETWNELRHRRWMLAAGPLVLALLAWGAPRVQLALAASPGAREAQSRDGEVDGIDPADALAAARVELTDGAKPQATGDDTIPSGDGQVATTHSATTALSPAAAGSEPHEVTTVNLAALMESLDRELGALENELRDLEPLLRQRETSPVVEQLSERIRSEIVRLAKRRDALRAQWKKRIP
jgi:beta-lactamase regulating signal transducer with metallopeptidase domain